MTPEELLILRMLKSRLFTPIIDITNQIFEGDFDKANELIGKMVKEGIVQNVNNRVTFTGSGKTNALRRPGWKAFSIIE